MQPLFDVQIHTPLGKYDAIRVNNGYIGMITIP